MNGPLITIFIPTYKRPKLLKKAIESALNQTYKEIQVVVCDDASKDETAEVVATLARNDARLHYICHAENQGMLANYQFCLSYVTTPFFSLLSDDDLLLPNFCETALNGFSQFPEILFFACSTLIISKEQGILGESMKLWPRTGLFLPHEGILTIIGKYPTPMTVLIKKEAIAKATIDFQNPYGWDCDFFFQLAGQGPFGISKEICGIFRSHDGSLTSLPNFKASIEVIHKILHRCSGFVWIDAHEKPLIKKKLEENIYDLFIASVRNALLNKQLKVAKETCYFLLKNYNLRIKALAFLIVNLIMTILPFTHKFLLLAKKIKTKRQNRKSFDTYTQLIYD